jgi:hypothetical protein
MNEKTDSVYWLLPILLGFIGGIVMYFVLLDKNPQTAMKGLKVGILITVVPLILFVAVTAVAGSDMMLSPVEKVFMFNAGVERCNALEYSADQIVCFDEIVGKYGTSLDKMEYKDYRADEVRLNNAWDNYVLKYMEQCGTTYACEQKAWAIADDLYP